MNLPLILSALITLACFGCSGSADHHDDHADQADHDAAPHEEPTFVPSGPARYAHGAIVVGDHEKETIWNRECVEPDHACEGDKVACKSGEADNPDDVSDPGDAWPRGVAADCDASRAAERSKEISIAGASAWSWLTTFGTKGVDLNAYNSVPGYRVQFECEREDESSDFYDQPGVRDSKMGFKSCELRGGVFSSRSVRLIVARQSGERIWEARMKISPSTGKTPQTDAQIADSKSGTSISIGLEGDTLRLTAAFFSTGWSKAGAAGNRNQGAVYLTHAKNDWMSKEQMPERFEDMPLARWVLPGSHDSGMFTHDSVGVVDKMAMTQTENIEQQLHLGMRFFDLRVGQEAAMNVRNLRNVTDTMPIYLVHGPKAGGSFQDAIRDTLRFLKSTAGNEEIVVFDVSSSGVAAPYSPPTTQKIWSVISSELARAQLSPNFAIRKDGLHRSPKELRALKARLIIVEGAKVLTSWNEADYSDPEKISPNVLNIAHSCTVRSDEGQSGVSLQLQATAPNIGSLTLQGNKLVLALLREVGPDPSAGVVAMSVIGVRVLAVAERTSG